MGDKFARFIGMVWRDVLKIVEGFTGAKSALLSAALVPIAGAPWILDSITPLRPYLLAPFFLFLKPVWLISTIFVMLLWKSFEQWDVLSERQKPILCVTCEPQDRKCKTSGNQIYFCFTIRVTSVCDIAVSNCIGQLKTIKKDGKYIWGGDGVVSPLRFMAIGQDSGSAKSFRPGETDFLEVLSLDNNGNVEMWQGEQFSQVGLSPKRQFEAQGTYELEIQILGDMPPVTRIIIFDYSFERTQCRMTIEPPAFIGSLK